MSIANDLVTWYQKNHRILPWRQPIIPYHTWVSEIMLQQTQVQTVIPYYERFLQQFPTVEDLAQADDETLMKAWEGLGYYSRARNLREAAQMIVDEGEFPSTYEALLKLKGVGPYTAGAIASIAFDEVVPAVDGNVLRIYSRLFEIGDDIGQVKTQKVIRQKVQETMSTTRPGDFNQALMDLGSSLCAPKKVHCEQCPLQSYCQSYQHGTSLQYPYKKPKEKPKDVYYVALALEQQESGEFLVTTRHNQGLLNNMTTFPLLEVTKETYLRYQALYKTTPFVAGEESAHYEAALNHAYPAIWQWRPLGEVTHVFSHRKWHLLVAYGITQQHEGQFLNIQHPNIALPKVQHKLNDLVLKNKETKIDN